MPELPEVETMVRGIRPHVEGARIVAIRKCRCSRKPITMSPTFATIARRSRDCHVVEVSRLAKRIVMRLDSGDRFVIEPRMTGLMLTADPPSTQHLRVEWVLSDGRRETSVWFWDRRGLGTLRLLSESEFLTLRDGGQLGPDALIITAEQFQQALQRTTRAIKPTLLDQRVVAGVGNLYASEILHLAGVHPAQACRELSSTVMARIHSAMRDVLELAIKYEGSTLGDGTYRNVLNQNGSYQNEHRVYARGGEICPTCQLDAIERIVQAQRSTFFCPHCQPQVRNRRRLSKSAGQNRLRGGRG